jgi:hypothetical protein
MESFNLKKLNEVEGKEKNCVEVSNRWKLIVLGKSGREYHNFSQSESRL